MQSDDSSNIKVVCRFRPLNAYELSVSSATCVSFDSYTVAMTAGSEVGPMKFTFDAVFPPDSRQRDVYECAARPTVESVLEGFNGTVFAYGQTGSGKTFTMTGPDVDDEDLKGVIPRMVRTVFDAISAAGAEMEFTVKVAYAEIYMEKLKDLLDPGNTGLQIREDKARGVYVAGITEEYVSGEGEVYDLMKQGAANREVGATLMNEGSSRSHALFLLTISQTNKTDFSAKTGKLYLVDLAGSEKVGKTAAEGRRLDEAKKINKSLSTLGLVIMSLTDGKSTHVPYRDSKLTRVLQDSLGGNSKTCLIITCSPSPYNEAETVSTLRFGVRAKAIKNKPKVNREVTVAELKLLLANAEAEVIKRDTVIGSLRKALADAGAAVPVDPELRIDEDEGRQTTAAFEELKMEIDAQREAVEDLRKTNAELQRALDAEVEGNANLEAQVQARELLSSNAALQVAALQKQLADRDEEIAQLHQETLRLQEDAKAAATALQEAESRAAILRESRELREVREVPVASVPSAEEVVDSQAKEIEELRERLAKTELQVAARTSAAEESLKALLEGERETNRRLSSELASLQAQLSASIPDYERLAQSIAQTAISSYEQQWATERQTFERDLTNRVEKVVQLEMELDNMKETNNLLLGIMSGGDRALYSHARRLEVEAQSHYAQVQKLLAKVARLSDYAEQQNCNNLRLKERLAEAELNLAESFRTIEELLRTKEAAEKQRESLSASAFSSMRSLKRVRKVIRGGSREVTTLPSVESDTE